MSCSLSGAFSRRNVQTPSVLRWTVSASWAIHRAGLWCIWIWVKVHGVDRDGGSQLGPPPPTKSIDLRNRKSSPCDAGQAGQANPSFCVWPSGECSCNRTGSPPSISPSTPGIFCVFITRSHNRSVNKHRLLSVCFVHNAWAGRREGHHGEETPRLTFVFKNGDGAYPNNSEIPRGCLARWVGHGGLCSSTSGGGWHMGTPNIQATHKLMRLSG